jgi:regulator of cell morphogenesis and NO signaling
MTNIEYKKPAMRQHKHRVNYASWNLDFLTNYIEKHLRKIVTDAAPEIERTFGLVCNAYKTNTGNVNYALSLFNSVSENISQHLEREESDLFPFVRNLLSAIESGSNIKQADLFHQLSLFPLLTMEHERESRQLESATKQLNSCNNATRKTKAYKQLLFSLGKFRDDWNLHIHLEQQIFFSKITNSAS